MPPVSAHPRGSELSLTISTRSAVNALELGGEGTVRVRIAAPPVNGAANAALIRFLAKTLDIPRSRLSISAGHTSRYKRIVVNGIAPADLDQRLQEAIGRSTRL